MPEQLKHDSFVQHFKSHQCMLWHSLTGELSV